MMITIKKKNNRKHSKSNGSFALLKDGALAFVEHSSKYYKINTSDKINNSNKMDSESQTSVKPSNGFSNFRVLFICGKPLQQFFLSRQDFTFITDSDCGRPGAEASKQSSPFFLGLELKSTLQMGQRQVLRLRPCSRGGVRSL